MSITIETVAQLKSFLKNETVNASSATNMHTSFHGTTWDLVNADINLKADTVFDMSGGSNGSGLHFNKGSKWSYNSSNDWKNNSNSSTGVAGSSLYTFNGQNSTIKNLHLGGDSPSSNGNVAFIGSNASGNQCNIKNITFQDCTAYCYSGSNCAIVASHLYAPDNDEMEKRPCLNNITVINPRVTGNAYLGGAFGKLRNCQEMTDIKVITNDL